MVTYPDENDDGVFDQQTPSEKRGNVHYLLWLLQQYVQEIESLERKLKVKPAADDDGSKQLSRLTRRDRLRNYCAPYVLARLKILNAEDKVDECLLDKLAA